MKPIRFHPCSNKNIQLMQWKDKHTNRNPPLDHLLCYQSKFIHHTIKHGVVLDTLSFDFKTPKSRCQNRNPCTPNPIVANQSNPSVLPPMVIHKSCNENIQKIGGDV